MCRGPKSRSLLKTSVPQAKLSIRTLPKLSWLEFNMKKDGLA